MNLMVSRQGKHCLPATAERRNKIRLSMKIMELGPSAITEKKRTDKCHARAKWGLDMRKPLSHKQAKQRWATRAF